MPQDPTTVVTRRDLIFLASSIFVTALVIRLVCYTGLIASDDMTYVGYARQIADGTYGLQPDQNAVSTVSSCLLPHSIAWLAFMNGRQWHSPLFVRQPQRC